MTLLRDWPRDAEARDAYVDSIFGSIALRYDLLTRLLSFGRERTWKARMLEGLPAGLGAGRVLDLACGTGALPLHLRERGFLGSIVGVDRSLPMLAVAARRLSKRGVPGVALVLGDLNALPIGEGTVDAVTMGYGLRYLTSIPDTLARIHRVLRPGGVFVSLDFGVPPAPWLRRLAFTYLLVFGTIWGLVLHGRAGTYWHIVESLRAYPGQRAVADWMRGAGFTGVSVRDHLGGVSAILMGRKASGNPERPG